MSDIKDYSIKTAALSAHRLKRTGLPDRWETFAPKEISTELNKKMSETRFSAFKSKTEGECFCLNTCKLSESGLS